MSTTVKRYIPPPNAKFINWLSQYEKGMDELMDLPGDEPFWKRAKDMWKNVVKPAIASCNKAWDKAKDISSRSHAMVVAFNGEKTKQGERQKTEHLVRTYNNEFVIFNSSLTIEQKADIGITLRDTEPSAVHGSHLVTGPPLVKLKNFGGAVIDITYRRLSDKDLPSVPKGFGCEWSYVIVEKGGPIPNDPDAVGMKSKLSSKAHFQLKAGVPNLGSTLYGFGRWKHKTNDAFDSPWTNLMQITIA